MPTIPFPQIPKISGEEIRAFSKRHLHSIESKYYGFMKRSDGFLECYSCGTKVKPICLTLKEIAKLHKPSCEVHREDLEYICRQSILISTRRPRGTGSFPTKVILKALSYGFRKESIEKAAKDFFVNYGTGSFPTKVILKALSYGFRKESIEKAAKDFFVNYGAFPEIGDLVEYLTRG